MLAVPLLGLAGLALIGAGSAALLVAALPPDARAALVIPVGAAVCAVVSTAVIAGVPVRVVAVLLCAYGVASAVRARLSLRSLVKAAAVPIVVLLSAGAIASIPSFSSGRWDAATFGNADPYYWVSQARALTTDPAPSPVRSLS